MGVIAVIGHGKVVKEVIRRKGKNQNELKQETREEIQSRRHLKKGTVTKI